VAQRSGTIDVVGLSAPVRVVRDRWGVPHIHAENADDLFAAQGFVQAEDRLFQMDLWRRASQGRLAEVLGGNFIERDAMTRRIQYRGDVAAEWASYGPDARRIAEAFVRGINAWVWRARERPPEPFVLAGWRPDFWSAADLLNRTDAFLESGDALDEVRRRDLPDAVGDALRRIGTPPFLLGLAAPIGTAASDAGAAAAAPAGPAARAPSSGGRASATRERVEFADDRAQFDHPSRSYLVHLRAPGWNVIGITAPWLPGVAVGHNERVAWAMAPLDADTQDIDVVPMGGPRLRVVEEMLRVKGRAEALIVRTELTDRGVVVASDRDVGRLFTLRWSGLEPGAAAGLGALGLDRAGSARNARAAIERWRMPPRRIAYADATGAIGIQDAALVPRRRGAAWDGWLPLDALPHGEDPAAGVVFADRPAHTAEPSAGALFAHVLAVSDAARRRFNVGPLPRPAENDSPTRAVFDLHDWDRSRAVAAPGQSEARDSPHYADLAAEWSAGRLVPLAFSDAAVDANRETTLTLVPAGLTTSQRPR
jgi:penicillin G amidase